MSRPIPFLRRRAVRVGDPIGVTGSGPRVELLGILDEAAASLTERLPRTLLTGLGTVLGVGVLVAVLGLTASAGSQIDSRFTALAATEVTVTQTSDLVRTRSLAFPVETEARIERVLGVVGAGLSWPVLAAAPVLGYGTSEATADTNAVQVLAASPGALRVAGAAVAEGRLYDRYAEQHRARVVVLGPVVAADLGITGLRGRPAITVGGLRLSVIGILGSVRRHPELLDRVIVPATLARDVWGDPDAGQPATAWVQVRRGAGGRVADQLATAISAASPDSFVVSPPPDPRVLRGSVSGDLRTLFLLLAGVCLIVGMVGIANTTFVTVMERLGEIGLRRALGAHRRHIAIQFLAEAAVIGLVGGAVGALLGLSVVLVTALAQGWTAVLSTPVIAAGPLIGLATALVAAAYPAHRASRTEPVVALRLGAS